MEEDVSKPKKTREEMDAFIDQYLEFSGGDIGMIKVLEKEASSRAWSAKNADKPPENKRYIRQEELSWTCYYLLEGHSYEESLRLAAEAVLGQHTELQEACQTDHKREFLNNMYDTATEENSSAFRKMKDQGYLKKSDYKGKTRPRTGLKNIERAVSHKDHHENLQQQVDTLKAQVEHNEAVSTIVGVEVEDINTLLGLGLTEEEKIAILLQHGYKSALICDIIGCNKFKVSRIKRKLKENQND